MSYHPDPDQLHDNLVQDLDEEFRLESTDRPGPPYNAHSNPDVYAQSKQAERADRLKWGVKGDPCRRAATRAQARKSPQKGVLP